jgi:predicted nicotinamide N-methyase
VRATALDGAPRVNAPRGIPQLANLIVPADAFPPPADLPDDQTGVYAWPAGDRMARDLPSLFTAGGETICDIGCGRGHLGFTALALGASAVVFADGNPEVCAGVRRVCAANAIAATVVEHQWGDPLPGGPFACILGGDLLYRASSFAALLASIAASLRSETGEALLSDPRLTLEPELPDLAAAAGLTWQRERRHDYTLVRARLRPRDDSRS